jgi:AcrR family transcriptional regulator
MRILAAMVQAACRHGVQSATVARVIELAGVSRKTFYVLFDDRDHCLGAAMEDTVDGARARAVAAYARHDSWVDSLRAGLHALLAVCDEERELARLCVVHALAGATSIQVSRREVLDELARVVDRGRGETAATLDSDPITAEALVGGALSVVHARLISEDPQPFVNLLNPLMSMIVLPYLGRTAARHQLSMPLPALAPARPMKRNDAATRLEGLKMRLTYRTLRVLEVIAGESGLGNNQVSERAGIRDQGQISKMLARLTRLGLTENTGKGHAAGAPNSWRLTPKGEQLERTFRREAGNARA